MYVLWLYVLFMHLQYVCFITLGMYVLWTFIIHACLTVAIQQACLSFEYPCMSGCCNTAGMPVHWISMHVCLLYYSRHVWQTLAVLWIYYTCIYVCCITSVMHVLWISMHANYRLNMFDQYSTFIYYKVANVAPHGDGRKLRIRTCDPLHVWHVCLFKVYSIF